MFLHQQGWHIKRSTFLVILSAFSFTFSSFGDSTQSFEEAAKVESQRQLANEQSPEAAETSSLESAMDSVEAPVIHLPTTPQKTERKEKDNAQDPLEEREERQWLLTGVMKLEGSYEENLTEEEKKALKERRERLGQPPRFVDHMAALKEKEREAAESIEDSIEADFMAEAGEGPDAIGSFTQTRIDEAWLFQSSASQSYRIGESVSYQTQRTTNYQPVQIDTMLGERNRVNPFVPDVAGATEPNRFIAEMSQPSRVMEAVVPEVKAQPKFIPDEPMEAPAEDVRRYKPDKDLDEKYFKDLRRF